MITLITLLTVVGLGRFVQKFWEQFNERVGEENRLRFWPWLGRGLVAPWLILTVFNTDWWPGLPPVLGSFSARAPASWQSFDRFYRSECLALWLIVLWWSVVSFAWLLVYVSVDTPRRSEWLVALLVWSLLALPAALVAGWLLGGLGMSAVLVVAVLLLVHTSFEYLPTRRTTPAYSKAIAKLKMGQAAEAEWALIEQLEQFENDFQGWMMLAEIYAEHHGDLAAAEQTVLELCAQENVTSSDVSVALHRLADWYLKLGEDPAGARFALEEICRRMPDTHMDKMARQRINRLPNSREELLEDKRGRTFALAPVTDPWSDASVAPGSSLTPEQATVRVEECVARLREEPNDAESRETLARLYAEDLERCDLGVEQLELLIEMPDQPAQKTMDRLQLMANWQINYANDRSAARRTLQRLVTEFPRSAQAFTAQRRLSLMDRS